MGDDWINYQIFNEDKIDTNDIVYELDNYALKIGLRTQTLMKGTWEYCVIVNNNWIHVADTFDVDEGNNHNPDLLPEYLSKYYNIISLFVSDSCYYRISLFEKGNIISSIQDGWIPNNEKISTLKNEITEKWKYFKKYCKGDFNEKKAYDLLSSKLGYFAACCLIFGWDADTSGVGYTLDFDGIPHKYDSLLEKETLKNLVIEKHWH